MEQKLAHVGWHGRGQVRHHPVKEPANLRALFRRHSPLGTGFSRWQVFKLALSGKAPHAVIVQAELEGGHVIPGTTAPNVETRTRPAFVLLDQIIGIVRMRWFARPDHGAQRDEFDELIVSGALFHLDRF
jgi:hypothetical protein